MQDRICRVLPHNLSPGTHMGTYYADFVCTGMSERWMPLRPPRGANGPNGLQSQAGGERTSDGC